MHQLVACLSAVGIDVAGVIFEDGGLHFFGVDDTDQLHGRPRVAGGGLGYEGGNILGVFSSWHGKDD